MNIRIYLAVYGSEIIGGFGLDEKRSKNESGLWSRKNKLCATLYNNRPSFSGCVRQRGGLSRIREGKHGKGLSLEYTNISCTTDFDSCLVFQAKGIGPVENSPLSLHSNSFPAFRLDNSREQQRVKLHMKTFVPDRTLGLQFKLIFAQLLEHSRGVARIFPWGLSKYRFHNFCKCNLGHYPFSLGCVIPRGEWVLSQIT